MRRNWRSGLLLAALAGVTAACASTEAWTVWRDNRAHFASSQHLAFSARHSDSRGGAVTQTDRTVASAEGWWGELVPAPPLAPSADVSGTWRGVWHGTGLFSSPRSAAADASFEQVGAMGTGRFRLHDTIAAEVPWIIRRQGSLGVPVSYTVSGSRLTVYDAAGGAALQIIFTVKGDRLVGQVQKAEAPVTIVLTRCPTASTPGQSC